MVKSALEVWVGVWMGVLLGFTASMAPAYGLEPAVEKPIVITGQLQNLALEQGTVNSTPPAISDGWSVSEDPNDQYFPVQSDGTFTALLTGTSAEFHRLTFGRHTVEVFAPPGATMALALNPDSEPRVVFSGDHARENAHLQALESAIEMTLAGSSEGFRAWFSRNRQEFSLELQHKMQSLNDLQQAFIQTNPDTPASLIQRADLDIAAVTQTWRLLYPAVHFEFTGSMAEVENNYYQQVLKDAGSGPLALTSSRYIGFLDKYLDLESAGAARYKARNLPREKLMSRYRAIQQMPMAPAIQTYLLEQMFRTFEDNYGPADWGRVVAALEADQPGHGLLPAVQATLAEAMQERRRPNAIDVYRQIDGTELSAHVFLPDGHRPDDQRAAFLTFHGGGWAIGTPEWSYPGAEAMAAKGLVAVSFEYRLADVHGTPITSAIADTRAAIRWARDHADELGIDRNRIIAHGFSAGAHLVGTAAMLPLVADEDPRVRPDALILHSSTYDTTKGDFFADMTGGQAMQISLQHNVGKGLVPALLLHGKYDHLAPEAEFQAFVEKMQSLDNPFEHHLFEVGHFFRNDDARDAVAAATDAFLIRHGLMEHRAP